MPAFLVKLSVITEDVGALVTSLSANGNRIAGISATPYLPVHAPEKAPPRYPEGKPFPKPPAIPITGTNEEARQKAIEEVAASAAEEAQRRLESKQAHKQKGLRADGTPDRRFTANESSKDDSLYPTGGLHKIVLDALAQTDDLSWGEMNDICREHGYANASFNPEIRRMLAAGLIVKLGRGLYALANRPANQPESDAHPQAE
jgi:hypothetical protein